LTIRPGEAWGVAFDGPDPVEVHDDPALARHLVAAPTAPVWLRGGDLHRSMGAPDRSSERMIMAVDLGVVRIDGGDERPFAAHVVVRRWGWRGRFLVILNSAYLGTWHAGPRAHPNDGRLDVIDGALGFRQRLQARRRAATGAHLPHPALSTSRVATGEWELDHPSTVWIDGRRAGRARIIEVRIQPDAGSVVA